MTQSILLPPLLLNALVVSVVLAILNRRGVGFTRSAAATAATTLVLVIVQWLSFGARGTVRQVLQYWLLWVLLPSAAILILAHRRAFVRHPWLLLLLGPISFVVALFFVTIAVNLSAGH
jgi:hypothetical protein